MSQQIHCGLVVCSSQWVTSFTRQLLNIHHKKNQRSFNCYTAGPTSNCCRLSASSVYTIQPCTFLSVTIRSHIGRVYVCWNVTCNVYVWQNVRDAVTREWNRYRKSQHRKLTLAKKILPPLLPGLEPRTFDHESAIVLSNPSPTINNITQSIIIIINTSYIAQCP